MAETSDTTAPTTAPTPDRTALLAAAIILVLAVALRLAFPPDPNIGWLTSVARIVADGGRLGRDIVETNPPMAVWIQIPAVVVERLVGWRAEPVQMGLVLLLGLAAAEHLGRRLAELGAASRFDRAVLYAAFLAAPLSAFAEREHVGLLLVVPMIALAMRRAAGQAAAAEEIVLAGLAAGVAAMIKPQFALPTMALALVLAIRRRSALPFFLPEFVLAGFAFLVYVGAVVVFVPAYAETVLPIVLDIYRPVKYGLLHMLTGMKTLEWLAALAALLWLERRRLAAPAVAPLVAAAIGFMLAYLEQGRGWPYHVYPAAALVAVAMARAAPAALTSGVPARRIAAVAGLLACLMPLPSLGYFLYPSRDLVAAIRAARPNPTIAAISMDLTPGHPITTAAQGRWVGTHSSRWITTYADLRKRLSDDPEVQARCDAWLAFDRAAANRDLAVKRPDIVLVGYGDRDWHAWIAADPETARLMANYRLLARQPIDPGDADRFEAVEAWIRSDLVTARR